MKSGSYEKQPHEQALANMDVIIVDHATAIRLGCFLGLFFLLAILEVKFPRRQRLFSRWLRWGNNLSLSLFNSVLVKMMFPVTGTALAVLAMDNGWGLLNYIPLPFWLSLVIYVVVFDFTIYWQHRLFHQFDFLWRLHRMHHTDLDYDLTTGNRFHPLSIILSLIFKMLLVLLMGPSVIAVLLSEILLNLTSMFNHSNIHIPGPVDRLVRLFLVTPDMHSIHHSQDETEHGTNFGFNFPWWDRLFGSYKAYPSLPQADLNIGLPGFDAHNAIWIHKLLLQPLENPLLENPPESDPGQL